VRAARLGALHRQGWVNFKRWNRVNFKRSLTAWAGKLTLVVESRLTGDDWFVFADPARVASMVYGYLAPAQGVQIQRAEAWDTLGIKYRAFLDFGTGWSDWRGAYHNEGAS